MAGFSAGKYMMEFSLQGVDRATRVLEKVDGAFRRTAGQADKMGGPFAMIGTRFGGMASQAAKFVPGGDAVLSSLQRMIPATEGAGIGFKGMAGFVAAAGAALFVFRDRAEQAAMMEAKMVAISGSVSAASHEFRKMQIAAGGAFSMEDLAAAQARVDAFNLPLKLTPEIMRAVQSRAITMGITIEHAMDSLTLGLARGSRKILDNLAVMVKIGEVEKNYAAAIGKTVDALTEEEKKIALVNETQKQLMQTGSEVGGSATEFQRIGAILSDMGSHLGGMLIPAFKLLRQGLEAIEPIIELIGVAGRAMLDVLLAKFSLFAEGISGAARLFGDLLIPTFRAAQEIIGDLLNMLTGAIRKGFDDLSQIVLSWSDGIAGGVENIKELGNEIAVAFGWSSQHEESNRNLLKLERDRADWLGKIEEAEKAAAEKAAEDLKLKIKELPKVRKLNEGIAKAMERSKAVLIDSEAGLLQMKADSGEISKSELVRLGALRTILRVESETSKIKSQIAANAKLILDIEKAHADFVQSGRYDPERMQTLEEQLEGALSVQEKLKASMIATVKEAEKPIKVPTVSGVKAKPEKFDLNKELSSIRSIAREEEKAIKIAGINIELRSVEMALITAKTEQEREALNLKGALLSADIKDIEGKRLIADHLREVAHARYLAAQAAREEAEATRDVNAALSSLGAMSGQFAGNELATMGTAMAGLASLSSKLEQGQIGVSEAIAGSGGVVAAAAGEFIESKRAIAAIMAVFETAAAFAAFPNVAAMTAHGTAAALYGGIAAGVGSVGGAGGAASPGLQAVSKDIDKERDRGDRQIVINISGVVTDAQGIGSQIKTALGSMEGTGV